MQQVPTTLRDRAGNVWSYQFGPFYADSSGRILRHRDSIARPG